MATFFLALCIAGLIGLVCVIALCIPKQAFAPGFHVLVRICAGALLALTAMTALMLVFNYGSSERTPTSIGSR